MEITLESKRNDMIAALQELGVEVNPAMTKEALFNLYQQKKSSGPVEKNPAGGSDKGTQMILQALEGMSNRLSGMEREIERMKGSKGNEFMMDAKTVDIEAAKKQKENIDPRLSDIVEKTLGIDFGIHIEGHKDKPGFLFTVLVPQRLSHVPKSTRPVIDEATGQYKLDKQNRIVEEEYWPGDPRSVNIGSSDSYDVIQAHCNKVRSFIVAYYQKMSKPIPEFKLR